MKIENFKSTISIESDPIDHAIDQSDPIDPSQ
jgi:hypothetical protein